MKAHVDIDFELMQACGVDINWKGKHEYIVTETVIGPCIRCYKGIFGSQDKEVIHLKRERIFYMV